MKCDWNEKFFDKFICRVRPVTTTQASLSAFANIVLPIDSPVVNLILIRGLKPCS